ncbi:MAG: hypothetical protein COA58_13960 [Bacteroidetes bacterium]|nr:MAG: hypothetical protein COA58_13960 [Bacteroidota bacterium]
MFTSENNTTKWSGNYKSSQPPQSTYFWILSYDDIWGQGHMTSGTVAVIY